MANTPQKSYVPLNQAAQGGLIDDLDCLIADAAFVQWDYNGNIDHEVLALGIQFQDDNGKTYDQYYSAGELTYFVPTDDGAGIVPVADKQLLNDNTNAMKFLMSLLECGFPDDKLASGNVKEMVGTKVHVKQQAQPKRQGLIRGGKNPDREPTVLLVSAILSLPGEQAQAPVKGKTGVAGKPVTGRPANQTGGVAKGGLGKGAPAGKPATTTTAVSARPAGGKANGAAGPATPAADDVDKGLVAEMVQAIVLETGGVAKKDLSKLLFQKATQMVQDGLLESKNKTKLVQLAFQDATLHELAQNGVIVYDGAQLSLPE